MAFGELLSRSRASTVRETGCVGGIAKRAIDVVIAATAIAFLAPLIMGICAILKWVDPGPLLFVQTRVGQGGRPFRCLKFRTMLPGADDMLAKVLASDPAAAREWARNQKIQNDPRVTPIGRFLRRTSLDELPQLLNVILGDMSMVGPRPVFGSELERYGATAGLYRRARPGLTGLWQVSGRSDTDYEFRVRLDSWYVANWSMWLDLKIMLRTLAVVWKRQGSC